MNEEPRPEPPPESPPAPGEPEKKPDSAAEEPRPETGNLDTTLAAVRQSTLYRLCEEVVALRERCDRQHREFEKSLSRTQAAFQAAFNTFAGDTQRAYQQLRQELAGEKRTTLTLFNELLELALDLDTIAAARPTAADAEALVRWSESVEVHRRKVREALGRHGIHPYDAPAGSPYNPALHERVGGRVVEGIAASRIVEQQQQGFASQQPDFVLRRPKVIVSE
jgi:molecular chaperone GrpE (heat shock protein)